MGVFFEVSKSPSRLRLPPQTPHLLLAKRKKREKEAEVLGEGESTPEKKQQKQKE